MIILRNNYYSKKDTDNSSLSTAASIGATTGAVGGAGIGSVSTLKKLGHFDERKKEIHDVKKFWEPYFDKIEESKHANDLNKADLKACEINGEKEAAAKLRHKIAEAETRLKYNKSNVKKGCKDDIKEAKKKLNREARKILSKNKSEIGRLAVLGAGLGAAAGTGAYVLKNINNRK